MATEAIADSASGDSPAVESSARNPLIGEVLAADTLNNVASVLVVAQTAIAHGGRLEGILADGLFAVLECAVRALEYEVGRGR